VNLSTLLDTPAYIDAGTGSYILAAIASGVAGLWMFFRSWLSRLKRKVRPSAHDEAQGSGETGDELEDQVEDAQVVETVTSEEDPATRG